MTSRRSVASGAPSLGLRAAGRLAVACCLAVVVTAAWAAESELEQQLVSIHRRAADAAAARDWLTVERLRLDRGKLLASTKEASPWAEARRAIEAVDGSPEGGKPGLVDQLRYREAAQKLLDAWKPFHGRGDGPVYGDVAVRLFKLSQQAVAIHRDAVTPGSPGELVSEAVLREAIETAASQDPCQIEARAIRLFLSPLDDKETFLRLEVRPELGAINAGLLDLSWPKSGVVLPHHAPVEFMKALLTHRLVMEERYGDFLEPESAGRAGAAAGGFALKGVDARSAPFRLMYGRFFLMEVADATGRPTAAFVYLDSKGSWDKKYLRLIYRTPDAAELKLPEAAFFADFFGRLNPTTTWTLGPHAFAIYDLPIEEAEPLIRRQVRKISVRKASGLARGKFSRTDNDPEFLADQLEAEPFPSHPEVIARIEQFAAARDQTQHALVDLMGLRPGEQATSLNPLVVMSSDDTVRPSLMFHRDSASGRPYLRLDDEAGSMLEFHEEAKELVVFYPGVAGHIPLVIESIPDSILLATAAGRILESVLVDSGYSRKEAIDEIRKAFKSPRYIPPKFAEFVKAKQRSRRAAGPGATMQIAVEILMEKGWSLPWPPGEDLQRVYRTYGFRYLTDARGTIITHPGLSATAAPQESATLPSARRLEFRFADGRQAIDESQVYTQADYERLRQNMATQFLPAVAALHPCLPALDWGTFGVGGTGKESAPVIPEEGFMDAGGGSTVATAEVPEGGEPGNGAEAALRNRLFAEYASLMLAARSAPEPREQVLAIHWKTARQLAESGCFHRAIVAYDELVRTASSADAGDLEAFRFDLFGRVPTPADLEAFSKDLQQVLDRQKRLVMMQAEQAGVLRAAGLHDSASYLFRRLADEFRHFVLPAIELSERYARSYAFTPSADSSRTKTELEAYLATIAKASAGLRREGEWRSKALEGRPDDRAVLDAVQAIEKSLREATHADDEAKQQLLRGIEERLAAMAALEPSLDAWARSRVAARRSAPQFLFEGRFLVNPVQACPCSYDPARGFGRDFESLIADDLPERIGAWARLPEAEAVRDPRAGEYGFMLGWYWLERGNADFAWTAFIEASKAFDSVGEGTDLAALCGRRNAMMMLVAAASVVDSPPGVTSVKSDFVDGLRAQAILWEREWVANRHDGGHAESQREIIDELLAISRIGIGLVANKESKRYWFPDYTYRHGPLPDPLVDDAVRMKLFEAVPRDAEDRPLATPPAKKPEPAAPGAPQEPEIPPRELSFDDFLKRLYRSPDATGEK